MQQEPTQPSQQQELNAKAQIWMAVSYEFQKKGMVYVETNQLSYYCCGSSGIREDTLGGNHGTRQHPPLHSAFLRHQQTFD